jgi:1-deoxy-D-xylulose-5-phosphate synthase
MALIATDRTGFGPDLGPGSAAELARDPGDPHRTPDTGECHLIRSIRQPSDLRALSPDQLESLAREIRTALVAKVSRTGGHLGPNLGVVELTIALHRVFESPRDRIVWDTGHQSYVHKMLTGRLDEFDRLRKAGGVSGYPSRGESIHDLVENSHASTALSYADGLAKAAQLTGATDRAVVAVVGDGALTGGMCWEALNNIGVATDRPVIVVVNDNGRSYAPTVGGLANQLTTLRTAASLVPQNLFEGLGLTYIGPVDGHDIAAMEDAFDRAWHVGGPVLVHCITTKGAGYVPAESHELDRFHAVGVIDPRTGRSISAPAARSWTSVFSEKLVAAGERRPDLVAITAAMLEPTGLRDFSLRFPARTFDVGIAEQHAVTSAAGLAMGGMHPVVAIYATFLNRAFDQALMDVALHRLPVTFVLDRAGVTGDDGASHNGMWDLSLLQLIPGMRIAVPRDGQRLGELFGEALAVDDGPTAIRFPKGPVQTDLPAVDTIADLDVLYHGEYEDVLIVAVGAMARICLDVAVLLSTEGIGCTVVDPRWIKPVSSALAALAARHALVVTVEDNGVVGGVGSAIAQAMRAAGVDTPLRDFGIVQEFLDHGTRADILQAIGLTAGDIAGRIIQTLSSRKRRIPTSDVPRP